MELLIKNKHLIPDGDYCYFVVSDVLYKKNGMPYHKIKPCPFSYGKRPDTGCMLYGSTVDACKICDFNDPEY